MKRFIKSTLFFYFIFFCVIEFLVSSDFISATLVPKPSQVVKLFLKQPEVLLPAILQTVAMATGAYLIASTFAFMFALLMHQFPVLQKKLTPLTLFFQTVPIIAIAPLLVIYLGFGAPSILAAALIVCFFPVFASTLVGLSQIQPNHNELFTFLKATRLQKLFYLEIPSAVPHILAGLKTAAGLSVVGVVSGEFVAGGGLGALIDSARLQQRVDLVFASLICLALIGLTLMKSTELLFRLIFKTFFVKLSSDL